MRYIQSISFPRSGHHILMRLLARYFARDLECYKSQLRGKLLVAGELVYCTYYPHCNKIPCVDPRTTIQKNHDFSLDLVNDPYKYYLIQTRNPLPAIISWFKYSIANENLVDSRESWEKFYLEKIKFYRDFLKKWITENENPNSLIIKYENFLSSPRDKLREAIIFCGTDAPIDEEWIKLVVVDANITSNSRIEDFSYLDLNFVRESNEQVGFNV